jgi:hypothetical protein
MLVVCFLQTSLDQSNDFSFVAGVFNENYVRLGLMADFDVSNRILFASMFLPQNAQIFVILRSLLCCSSQHHITSV